MRDDSVVEASGAMHEVVPTYLGFAHFGTFTRMLDMNNAWCDAGHGYFGSELTSIFAHPSEVMQVFECFVISVWHGYLLDNMLFVVFGVGVPSDCRWLPHLPDILKVLG